MRGFVKGMLAGTLLGALAGAFMRPGRKPALEKLMDINAEFGPGKKAGKLVKGMVGPVEKYMK